LNGGLPATVAATVFLLLVWHNLTVNLMYAIHFRREDGERFRQHVINIVFYLAAVSGGVVLYVAPARYYYPALVLVILVGLLLSPYRNRKEEYTVSLGNLLNFYNPHTTKKDGRD